MSMPDQGLTILSPDVLADPYSTYQRLREEDPVHWDERLQGWVVTRHKDVHAASMDAVRYSSASRVQKMISSRVPEEMREEVAPLVGLTTQWVSMSDPPMQTRLRSLLQKAFSPRAVTKLEPQVTEMVREMLGRASDAGGFDVMADFAYILPAAVMADIYGLPRGDAELLKHWWDSLRIFFGASPDLTATLRDAMTGVAEMEKYFTAVIQDKRAHPGDDVISHLAAAPAGSEGFMSDEELYSNLIFVLGASYSTMDMIGNGVHALLKWPQQWKLLVDNPSLAGRAVEEFLRYDAPIQVTMRTATCEIDLHGRHIAPDDSVFLVRGSANRDPEEFADPDRLDITREPTGLGHVAFGVGAHYCVGAVLAKVVGRVSFEEIATSFPALRVDPDAEIAYRADTLQFRGLRSLPVFVS